jgi:hypothetical protein
VEDTCGLTLRSSGVPTARHHAREVLKVFLRLAGAAPHRRPPLSSNVRAHQDAVAMNPTTIHLHAYAGRENGLMIIGSTAALRELGCSWRWSELCLWFSGLGMRSNPLLERPGRSRLGQLSSAAQRQR